MAPTPPNKRPKANLEHLIRDGAREVLNADGYEGLSIRKVARAIGYSPGTIYLYYKDKDALLLALQREAFTRKAEAFRPLMRVGNTLARLEAMGRSYIDHALTHPADFNLMFVDRCPMEALAEEGAEWRQGTTAFEMLQATIREGIDNGQLRASIPVKGTALMLWSMVHGCAMLILSQRLIMLSGVEQEGAIADMFSEINHLLAA